MYIQALLYCKTEKNKPQVNHINPWSRLILLQLTAMLFILQRKETKKKRRTDTSSRPIPLIYGFFPNIRHFLKNSTVVDRLGIQN